MLDVPLYFERPTQIWCQRLQYSFVLELVFKADKKKCQVTLGSPGHVNLYGGYVRHWSCFKAMRITASFQEDWNS